MNAIIELYQTSLDAWRSADLLAHLEEWWMVTHPDLVDSPTPRREGGDDA
jgi:hypothetical protein